MRIIHSLVFQILIRHHDSNNRLRLRKPSFGQKYDQEDGWEVELEFEMVYNRCILYEADQLHAQWYSEDAFTTKDRIAQVLFI